MSEQTLPPQSESTKAYLAQHPNAVQDKNLALEMAIAGDPHESEAARLRSFGAQQLLETTVNKPGSVTGIAAVTMNAIVPKINRENAQADQKYAELELKPHDFAADAQRALDATKR